MLAKRIIPCLDVDAGRVVKGVRFQDLRDAGDPVELAARYDAEGADELVFLDITATVRGARGHARRGRVAPPSRCSSRSRSAAACASADDVRRLLRAGADKVALNSAAVRDPDLLVALRRHATARNASWSRSTPPRRDGGWEVFVDAGRTPTGRDAVEWAAEATAERGAGEILLTSMDRDGTGDGYDLELLEAVRDASNVPVIASGGAGTLQHFADGARAAGRRRPGREPVPRRRPHDRAR